MHSSRMRTGRSMTVCRGGLLAGGSPCWGVSLPGGGFFLPGGFPCQGGLPARGVSPLGGPPCQGGLPARGGSHCRGVSLRGDLPARGVLPARDPPMDKIIDTSKNITLATNSLRPVTMAAFSIAFYV